MTSEELKAQIVEKANTDETFRSALLDDPQAAISELAGGSLPAGFSFDPATELGELTDEELATVAGAGCLGGNRPAY